MVNDQSNVIDRSVIDDRRDEPVSQAAPWLWALTMAARFDNDIPSWGSNIKLRDRRLREFIDKENLFASALGIVAARNAALSWDVTGENPRLVAAAHEMLNNVNFGGGWEEFIVQTTLDLATQDNGAWVEIVRSGDSPNAPCIGLSHLDSARVWQTGNPETPAIYQDSGGGMHPMQWYQVAHLLEIPAGVTPEWGGFFYKAQYCTLSRLLRRAQIAESTNIYMDEKLGGRFNRAVHLLQGIGKKQVDEAMALAQHQNDGEGLMRYAPPIFVSSVNQDAAIDVKTVELAGLPDGWNEDQASKLYILALSMAFMTDYQEFAPLPGGNLGTSAQSEILDKKSRGKGPALFQRLITRIMNLAGVLPEGVQFAFNEPDADSEEQHARIREIRSRERQLRIASQELPPWAARQVALDDGDLSAELFDEIARVEAEAEEPAAAPGDDEAAPTPPDAPTSDVTPETSIEGEERGERAAQGSVSFGPLIMSRLHRAYSDTADDVAGLGYFDTTDQRVEVASAIGPALQVFEDALRDAGIWDMPVSGEDVDRIVEKADKVLGGIDVNANTPLDEVPAGSDEAAREAIEADVAVAVGRGLDDLRDSIRSRLHELAEA